MLIDAYETSYLLYFVVLGIALWYVYKSAEQIRKKDFEFFKKEIYTKDSVKKWSVVDGWLRIFVAVLFIAYGCLGLAGFDFKYYVLAGLVVALALYLFLYKKTLVKKSPLE